MDTYQAMKIARKIEHIIKDTEKMIREREGLLADNFEREEFRKIVTAAAYDNIRSLFGVV